ncbi:MAG: hypothetical protein KIH65_000795 [Candidatus Uhrbacteria bacterium]|nr:hypothetical protein [Candidatus Uhrbacteria bacterium]
MSLCCGACRNDIDGGFGLLYRLERAEDRSLRYPDQKQDYVPPNSAVCDHCWEVLPKEEKGIDSEEARAEAECGSEPVFVYLPASGKKNPLSGSVSLLGISTWDGDGYTFVRPNAVQSYLPLVVQIIDGMTKHARSQYQA